MSSVEIRKVADKKSLEAFIQFHYDLYRDNPYDAPNLHSDEVHTLSKDKNAAFEFCEADYFLAYRDGKVVGRIAGIINRRANERWNTKSVRFGWVDFIDDMEVSRALLQAVEEWGRTHGMEMMQGPLGITDFDKEGMLVEDFDMIGSINTIYNPEYYHRHMEALGLEKEVDWLQVHIDIPQDVPARYARVAQYAREQIGLRLIKLTNKQIFEEGYGKRVFDLLNEAYKPIFGFSALSPKQMDRFLNKYIKMVDKQLIPVILNDKDEMVGVAVSMGSLSKSMQKTHGRLLPFGWYHLVKALKWHHEDNAEMLLIAIRPDYQGLGVNAMFFDDLIPIFNKCGFKWAETGPQLEDNVRELTQWKPLHPKFVKRRRCYKKKI